MCSKKFLVQNFLFWKCKAKTHIYSTWGLIVDKYSWLADMASIKIHAALINKLQWVSSTLVTDIALWEFWYIPRTDSAQIYWSFHQLTNFFSFCNKNNIPLQNFIRDLLLTFSSHPFTLPHDWCRNMMSPK